MYETQLEMTTSPAAGLQWFLRSALLERERASDVRTCLCTGQSRRVQAHPRLVEAAYLESIRTPPRRSRASRVQRIDMRVEMPGTFC